MGNGSQFFARLTPDARTRLLASGSVTQLNKGDRLIRRGDKGGDVYIVEEGTLDIVDDRFRPEVVLGTIGPGEVVGEMSFMDEAPRSADVWAASPARCRHLEREALAELLDQDQEVAVAFYRALAESMTERNREFTTIAALGGLGRRRGAQGGAHFPWMTQQAGEITARARARWIHTQRSGRAEHDAEHEVVEATLELVEEASAWLSRYTDAEQAEEAGGLISEEIQGWLARTGFARRLSEGPGPMMLESLRAWALDGTPEGDEDIGIGIDRALLDLPSFVALRRSHRLLIERLNDVLSRSSPRRTLMLSVNPKHLLEPLQFPGEVLLLGGAELGSTETVLRVEANLLALAEGRQRVLLESVDLVVIDGLLEHLPDRWAVGALAWAASNIAAGRPLLWIHAAPSREEAFVRDVLGLRWIRRSQHELLSLAQAARLDATSPAEGVVWAAAR